MSLKKTAKRFSTWHYNPDAGGDYVHGAPGFISRWDMAAEQKMMYLQAASRLDPALARRLYRGLPPRYPHLRWQTHHRQPGWQSLCLSLQREAWLDTAHYLDPNGIDWFDNTRRACLANRPVLHRTRQPIQNLPCPQLGLERWG